MTNKELYNKIRTHMNKTVIQSYRDTLNKRAQLGSKEAQHYMASLKPLDQRPSKTSKS